MVALMHSTVQPSEGRVHIVAQQSSGGGALGSLLNG